MAKSKKEEPKPARVAMKLFGLMKKKERVLGSQFYHVVVCALDADQNVVWLKTTHDAWLLFEAQHKQERMQFEETFALGKEGDRFE